ncbi:type II secretion system minor pseudopilin GspI [Hyphococcus flavus]|uniref:Type II secretion system protein I n=1 Tax=Hyphococcus flavus TaxID=1866326 RepID=A0AAE9ZBR4_9PROT|nr:type II secretion system minor pseudopilin GspI [Hyphococcus flavus]WDI31246.1 type II secretion system minor pseudopilin GspI [Hyphococcus flavus]
MTVSMRHKQQGVTLVETLVALAVMGFVVAGLLVLIGQNTRFASSMEERTYASIAADNLMVEALTLSNAREIGETDGQTIVGDRTWNFRRIVSETPIENVVRIDIEITPPDGEQVLAFTTSLRRVE